MNEQINEKFADKLLNTNIWNLSIKEKNRIKKLWQEAGYMKQPRKEEIEKKLKNLYPKCSIGNAWTWEAFNFQKELIEILNKEIKEINYI